MLIPALLLNILGITIIYSSSTTLAAQQALFGLVGLALFLGISRFDFRAVTPFIIPAYILFIILLLIVFILGFETRGSIRWIPLGPFNFQPSEFAKPVLILALAHFWSTRVSSWKNIGLSLLILLPFAGLIFKQPDLGTTLTVVFIWIVMIFSVNVSIIKLGILSLLGGLLVPVSWFFLHDYQRQRFLSFLSPTQDPAGNGYNVIQSTIAVGSGELLGRGLGRGTQSRLQFLPEFRTDFIFASIAEDLGLLGSLIVLSLYTLLIGQLFRLIFRVQDHFGTLILIGILGMFFFQVVVNIGMNVGIMPITGITLPWLSYGGSSLITNYICLGLAVSIASFGVTRVRTIDREEN